MSSKRANEGRQISRQKLLELTEIGPVRRWWDRERVAEWGDSPVANAGSFPRSSGGLDLSSSLARLARLAARWTPVSGGQDMGVELRVLGPDSQGASVPVCQAPPPLARAG